MTTTTHSRLYPGMLSSGVELFKTDDGVKVIASGTVMKFQDIPVSIYRLLREKMRQEKKSYTILRRWYPNSELSQLEKFAECRLGGLDYTPDIINNELQDGEYHDCPFRSKCEGNGVICKALKYNGEVILDIEIKLLRLLATNDTNEVIAEKLNVSYGQYHKLKKVLYAKLGGIQTKQEATIKAIEMNLINIKNTSDS